MAAEAVRGDQHRCAFGVDRVGDARDPFALVGIVPRAEIDSLAVGEFLFPQALPMGRAAVVKARNRQDFMMDARSEEHTSELQSLMRISYAVFCLKKKKQNNK